MPYALKTIRVGDMPLNNLSVELLSHIILVIGHMFIPSKSVCVSVCTKQDTTSQTIISFF